MRLSLTLLYAAAALAATTASAARTTAPPPTRTMAPPPTKSTDASGSADTDSSSSGAGTVRPPTTDDDDDDNEDNGPMPALPSPLDALKYKRYSKKEWHMGPVRMVHARVQSDDPALADGRFVSSFGGGDLEKGYLSAMDNVNTASVEGALMYVQAEGINVNARAKEDRCKRKNNMRNIVFYDIVMVQPNETIAEYSSTWQQARDTFEYGPMVPMDGGKCTPEMTSGSKESLPKACLQYNGEGNEPNLGPFIGGYIKDDDVRAPYPNTYWFSFPNTCPTKGWAQKTDKCRKATRKGLCDLGVGPDGVTCTFAYDILGWIPIDDVVGITSIKNKATGETYRNFTEWCEASTRNNEFVGDVKTGKMKSGLKFWQEPLDEGENSLRAQQVVDLYNQLVSGEFVSTQIHPKLVKSFKPLPEIDSLRAGNPPCFTTVPACNSNYGCRREGYAQLCKVCTSKLKGCMMDEGYEYPKLAKAPRYDDVVDSESSSNSGSDGSDETTDGDTEIESPKYEEDSETKTKAPVAQSSSVLPAAALATTVVAALASMTHV